MASHLEINLLGTLELIHNNSPITANIPLKSQALLAYLAVTRTEQSRHTLAGLFWGDRVEVKAKNNLRVAINGLRKLIPDHLDVMRLNMGLKFDDHLVVDTHVLSTVADDLGSASKGSLEEVIQLYRGDFLLGVEIEEAPEFDEWRHQQRTFWRQTILRILSRLAEMYLEDAEYDRAIVVLDRQLEIDRCDEEAYRRSMIAHTRLGDLTSAIQRYHDCVQALADDLGVEPTPETVALFQQIQSAEQVPNSSSSRPTQSSPLLIGRESELEQLRSMLNNSFCRLITLAGFGGVGKTQLAKAIVEEIEEHETIQFLHGVHFVSLLSIESVTALPQAIADALSINLSGRLQPMSEIVDNLRGKEMLLVLDNFEHLLDGGVELINDLLNECAQLKLLITSREWLNLGAEWRLGLEGLSYPSEWQDAAPDDIKNYAAIRFFVSEANRVRPGFQIEQDEVHAVCQLCELVGGIPLALMLAANWLRTMSIEAIAREVQRDMDILTVRIRNMPARQRSMRVVFESSWNRLLPHEGELFQALSVFRGGFTVEAVSHLVYDEPDWVLTLDILDALADKGMVQYDSDSDRYHLHELLRQCGAEKLALDPESSQQIRLRHSRYYCGQLADLEQLRKGPQQLQAFTSYVIESENMFAAWQTATQNQEIELVAHSMDSLGTFFEWRTRFADGVHLFESAVQMLHILAVSKPEPRVFQAFAKALAWLGGFYRMTGKVGRARETIEQCARILERDALNDVDLRSVRAFYFLQLGHLDLDLNNEAAYHWYEQSLELYRSLSFNWETAVVLDSLSRAAQSIGDLKRAAEFVEESLLIRQKIGDQRGRAEGLALLSSITRFRGDIRNAIRYARESHQIYQSIGDKSSTAEGLHTLGMTLNYSGEYSEALSLLEQSIDIYESLHNQKQLAMAHANASHVAACLGDYEHAGYHARQTVTLGTEVNDLRAVANGYTLLAWHAVVRGNFDAAIDHLQRGEEISRRAGGHPEEDINRSVLGYALEGMNRIAEAQSVFLSLLSKVSAEKDFLPLITALPKISLMILQQVSTLPQAEQAKWQTRAIIAYQVMRRWPIVSNSQLLEKAVNVPLRELSASLSPNLFTEEVEAAKALDIWDVVEDLVKHLPDIGWDSVAIGAESGNTLSLVGSP